VGPAAEGIGGQKIRFGTPGTTHGIEMQKDEIQKKVAEVKLWFHKIDLGHGIVTPGFCESWGYDPLNLPDLRGRTVLDVGCADGLYSFECEKRGAKQILATDQSMMEGFLAAREILNSTVEYKEIDVFDISPQTVGTWDIVLFMGVFYHLKNPLFALEKLAQVTRYLLVVESHIVVLPSWDNVPLMTFYETNELMDEASNWWGPNVECLIRMTRSAGFELVELQRTTIDTKPKGKLRRKSEEVRQCVTRLFRKWDNEFYAASSHRAIVHAWKQKEMKEALQ